MLVGSHVPTNFQMYRQKSEKALLGGGGGQLPPPCPPLATLMPTIKKIFFFVRLTPNLVTLPKNL